MLKLDHLSVVAPSLAEGVAHVREAIDLDIPFGQRHVYMGTYNHLLQLGEGVYLEIIAPEPGVERPSRPRWFGLDDIQSLKRDWDSGRRLRGWVARTDNMNEFLAGRKHVFGKKVSLPWTNPAFDFAIPDDGSLPLGGAAPSIIDRRGKPRSMSEMPDLGARLLSFLLEHPDAAAVTNFYEGLHIDRPPSIVRGNAIRYAAQIRTPFGIKVLS